MPTPARLIHVLLLAVLLLAAQLGTAVHALEHDHHEHVASCDLFIAAEHNSLQCGHVADFSLTDFHNLWQAAVIYQLSLPLATSYLSRAPPSFR